MTALRHGALRQLAPAVLALVGTIAGFTATATPSHAAGGYYSVTLATALDAPKRLIEHGVSWSCTGSECSAARDTSRPAMVCARISQKVGTIARFATPEGELSAEELARCNGGKA